MTEDYNGRSLCDWYWKAVIEMGLWRGKRLLLIYISSMFLAVVWVLYTCDMPGSSTGRASTRQDLAKFQKMVESLKGQQEELVQMKLDWKNKERVLIQTEVKIRQTYGAKALDMLSSFHKQITTIYAITPTYTRPEQKAELTRLKQTFLHIPNFHWIIVEDSDIKTKLVSNFLRTSGLNFTHLNVVTPGAYKMTEKDPNWLKPRGVLQRNLALQWLRDNLNVNTDSGVIYFADDDNTYDLQLFEEMRSTQKVSVWPVGLVGYLRYERPIVTAGKVVGWFTYWKPDRPFAMDMAGFAINLRLILEKSTANFSLRVRRGYQESELLRQLVTMEELEPLADQCTKILVWHTRTEKSRLDNENKMLRKYGKESDADVEV